MLLICLSPVVGVAVLEAVQSVCVVLPSIALVVKRLKIFENREILFVSNYFRVLINQLLLIFPKTSRREGHRPTHNFTNSPPDDPEEQN